MKIKEFLKEYKYILVFSFLLISLSLFMMILFTKESDYFWHIKAGEYMLRNKSIITNDMFSWFLNGNYWMSHEWLFEYILYLFKHLFGNFHLFLYPFICVVSLLFILFFTNKTGYLKNIIFSLIWISLFLIFCVYIQARPHMISFVFLALTIYFSYDLFWNENSKKIFLLPIITILWSNFHGGSSNLSYLFCFIFLFVGLFNFKFSKIEAKRNTKKQIFKYLIVAFLCIISICFNPHGIKMLFYPYSNMLDTLMISSITEWQPTVLNNFSHLPYFLLVLIIVLVMVFSKKKIRFIDFILLGIVVFLGLKSIRFWAYTYIVMTFVVFHYVSERKYDKGTSLVIFIIGCIFSSLFVFNIPKMLKMYEKKYISDNMISVIKDEKPKRLYNMYDFGGELIYNDISVFVDGRADLYSKYNLKDCLDISTLNNDYINLIDKYNFDYFLVDRKYPINNYLKYNDDYEVIDSEKNIILYKKKI